MRAPARSRSRRRGARTPCGRSAAHRPALPLAAKIQQDILLSAMEAHDTSVDFTPSESHVVSKGDTLSAIAARYKTSVDVLKRRNNLTSSKLSVGQRLLL